MTPRIQRLKQRKAEIAAMGYTPTACRVTPPANRRHCKPVLCVTTGKRFPSLLDAAAWLSEHLQERCSSSAVGQAIRRGVAYKGFQFKYSE